MADLTTRVVNILKSPQTEWPVIAAEPTDVGSLYKGYIIPLAAIGPICNLLGMSLIGSMGVFGTYRAPLLYGLVTAILMFAFSLVGYYISAMVIEWLAPKFKSAGSRVDALKMVAYASTPAWVAGVLYLVPVLGLLVILAALYGIYLFYLGLPPVMKTPSDQVVPYMVVAAVVIFVITVIISMIVGAIGATMLYSTF